MWYVEIVDIKTGEVIKRIECETRRKAERVEDGVNINLNYERYYTCIVDPAPAGGEARE